jgi:hypothetical protein
VKKNPAQLLFVVFFPHLRLIRLALRLPTSAHMPASPGRLRRTCEKNPAQLLFVVFFPICGLSSFAFWAQADR